MYHSGKYCGKVYNSLVHNKMVMITALGKEEECRKALVKIENSLFSFGEQLAVSNRQGSRSKYDTEKRGRSKGISFPVKQDRAKERRAFPNSFREEKVCLCQ